MAKAKDSPTFSARAIGKKALVDLVDKANRLDTKRADATSSLGQLVSEAAENQNLHKKAFALARWCKRQDDAKTAEFLFHFDTYRKHLGLDDITAKLLPDGDEEEGDGKKVTPFRTIGDAAKSATTRAAAPDQT